MDIDPTLALEVATKQYVDHYSTWRRPVLQFGSVTTVAVEAGLDGTSGNIPILFPDGTVRTETSTTRTTFDITRNAVLTTSGAQSGLRTSLSEATNTWYALYAVKVTDSSTLWCTVGDTRLPLQANYANLNTAFGTSGWVYLGLIRNGDNSAATGDILSFTQVGNTSFFKNDATGTVVAQPGILLATTAGAASLSYTYAAGTGTTQIPNNVLNVIYCGANGAGGSGTTQVLNNVGAGRTYAAVIGTTRVLQRVYNVASDGLSISNGSSITMDIFLNGFCDGALGIGSNPLL